MLVTFKQKEINKLFDWLDMPLRGNDAITRHRFLKNMYDLNQEILGKKQAIFEKYTNKDANGEPIITPELKYDIPKADMEKVESEIKEIDEVEVEVEVDLGYDSTESTAVFLQSGIVTILKEKMLRGMTIAEARYFDDVISKLIQ